MDEQQQSPAMVWCGDINSGQDVSIRLVPNGINQDEVTSLGSQEPLAVFKLHSTRLNKHSNYFQACFSKRWTNPGALPAMEFNLELIHGLQVASYADSFSRMYTPLRKNFKDVQSCLELLQVASQIEFHKLLDSDCRYLSTILWSKEDELRIRHFSSSPDFPRSQAQGLVARLEAGNHGNEEHRKELLCGHIGHSMRIALRQNEIAHTKTFRSAQSLFEDLFSSIRQSEIHSAFEDDVVTIVNKEVKEMLESFHEDCRAHAASVNRGGETLVVIQIVDERVSDFKRKLKALGWALELLLKTQVAEEVVECLLHLELFVKIILTARSVDLEQVALKFYKLAIFMFQEVVAGRLLLEIPDRVLLIERWQYLTCLFIQDPVQDSENDIPGFGQALEGVFLTLPLQQQLEVLHRNKLLFERFMRTKSLITVMKRNWPSEEDAYDLEVERDASHISDM